MNTNTEVQTHTGGVHQMPDNNRVPVIVFTSHRGIFFGYTESPEPDERDRMRLTNTRMVVYYDQTRKSAIGLASLGASDQCKVSPAIPLECHILGVTMSCPVTSEVAESFEAAPWM